MTTMSEQKILQKKSLGELFQKLTAAGHRVLAPVRTGEQLGFEEVTSPQKIADDYIQTTRSAKAALFPRYDAEPNRRVARSETWLRK